MANNRGLTLEGMNELFAETGITFHKEENLGFYYARRKGWAGNQLQARTLKLLGQKIINEVMEIKDEYSGY